MQQRETLAQNAQAESRWIRLKSGVKHTHSVHREAVNPGARG